MAQLPPWMKGAVIVTPAEQVRPDTRGAVEFAPPQAPMSPAEATRLGIDMRREQQGEATTTWQRMTPEEVAQAGLNPSQIYQRNMAGKIEAITGASLPPVSPNRPAQIRSALDALKNIRKLAEAPLSVGETAGRVRDFPFIGAIAGQNRADLEGSLSLIEGSLIQDQLRELAKINPGGVSSLANSETEARRLASSIANLDPNQSLDQFLTGVTRAEEYYNRQLQMLGETPEPGQAQARPGTAPGMVMGAVQGGQLAMSPQDIEAGKAIQDAWNRTGRFDDVAAVAARFGRNFGEKETAFLRANEGKPVNIVANPTGTPTATEQAIGSVVATPAGEAAAAGLVAVPNAMTFGMLDELAPVLGLDADRVQMAKRYLQERNPGMSLAGEIGGSILPTGMVSRSIGGALAGTRAAGMAPLIGDVTAGALAGAGEANENRFGGALLGGTLGGAGGAAGRRMFGGGATPPDAGMPPSGPVGGMGGMGGAGQRVSAGAAATPTDVIRVFVGEGLPVPVRLMNFQKTRDFADVQRARELAKNNELGGPIRETLARQQQEMASNFDAFLDKTGAQIWKGREDRGIRVTNALEKMAAQDKARVRTLYNQAAKSADAQTKVPLNQLVPIQIGEDGIETTLLRYFTSQPIGVPSSGTVDAARQFAVNLGVLSKNEAGDLIAANPTVKNMEELRREISGIGNPADPNSIRQETILKRLIDAHTEPYAIGAYALARAARKEVSDKYESVSTIVQLLGTKKRTPERVIAAEKVMDRLLSGTTSAANLRSLKGLLTGADGDPQAWQEVQGALVEKIRTAAYPKGATADEAGQKSISPAALRGIVQEMDESGKLDIVFEPEVARGMRDLADIAEYVFTAPPGSVNFSNTSSAWVNAFDMLVNTGISGIPLKGGFVNNVLIPLKNAAKNREAKKEVRRLVGDNAQ